MSRGRRSVFSLVVKVRMVYMIQRLHVNRSLQLYLRAGGQFIDVLCLELEDKKGQVNLVENRWKSVE